MKKQVLIIGGNGHGSVIAACIKDNQKTDTMKILKSVVL